MKYEDTRPATHELSQIERDLIDFGLSPDEARRALPSMRQLHEDGHSYWYALVAASAEAALRRAGWSGTA